MRSNAFLARAMCYHKLMTSSRDTKNFGGRPATGKGTPVMVRMQPDLLAALDRWIDEAGAVKGKAALTRPEAVRRLAAETLQKTGLLAPDLEV